MKLIKLYYSPHNNGDGSVSLTWFLTEADARYDQDHLDEGWGEDCSGKIDSYEGSAQHKKAIENGQRAALKAQFKKKMKVQYNDETKTIAKVGDDYISFTDGTYANMIDISIP